MGRFCRWMVNGFAVLYVLALALFAVGTFGLFGSDQDPLSGVFLVPLGLPWNLLVDFAPENLWPWLAALAPAINLAILAAICRWSGSRKS